MPEPLGLGTVGKTLALTIDQAIADSNRNIFDVMLSITEGDHRTAFDLLYVMLERNNTLSRTLTFMRADAMTQAQDEIMEVKLLQRGHADGYADNRRS